MAIDKIHKLNIRSPYFINVVNESDLDQDDIQIDPVEPVSTLTAIECGANRSVGVDVGTHKYEFTALGRELGTYTITFTGIKIPIKYRIGIKGNMPASFTTSGGWSTYEGVWESATGESVTLTDPTSAVNGVTETVTYTSTQSDIDTYGTMLELEIQQPVPTVTGYSIGLSCPNLKTISSVNFGTKVLVLHIYNRNSFVEEYTPAGVTNKINGEDASWLTLPSAGTYKTFIFADHFDNDLTPTVPSLQLYRNYLGNSIPFNSFLNDVVYRPSSDLNPSRNTFEFNLETGTSFGQSGDFDMFISTHRIEDTNVGGVVKKTFAVSEWSDADLSVVALAQNSLSSVGNQIRWTYTVDRNETVDSFSNDHLTSVLFRLETFMNENQPLTNQTFTIPVNTD